METLAITLPGSTIKTVFGFFDNGKIVCTYPAAAFQTACQTPAAIKFRYRPNIFFNRNFGYNSALPLPYLHRSQCNSPPSASTTKPPP